MNARKIANQLNKWFQLDPDAVTSWAWGMYTQCNDEIASDPNIQVRRFSEERVEEDPELEGYWLTPLGLLNGLLLDHGSLDVVTISFGPDQLIQCFTTMPYSKCKCTSFPND